MEMEKDPNRISDVWMEYDYSKKDQKKKWEYTVHFFLPVVNHGPSEFCILSKHEEQSITKAKEKKKKEKNELKFERTDMILTMLG